MAGSSPIKIHCPVIGIGASAGGLEALEKFFRNLPENNGLAFVVIQHLDPDHTGVLPELLQRITAMKVMQADNNHKVKPDHVYVIPPNKSLTILNGVLFLSDPSQPRGLRLPIDIFFRSLAEDRLEHSVGIVLSGMGSDGSLGIKAIKERNGLVLVQEPADAKFDGMPRSATQSVNPDVTATAEELPSKLIALLKIPASQKKQKTTDDKSDLEKIIFLLRQKTGHDFSLYKKTTLLRRIERRLEVHQMGNMPDYIKFLVENPAETEILFKELLIGVTNFFRDPELWEKLKEEVFPELIKRLPDGYTIRAWIPGCSTGEEAYSLAITFREALAKSENLRNLNLQIFATDIDHDAVERARKGFFTPNMHVDVSPELTGKYFIPEGDGYRINTSIREMIVFAEQNIIRDPPFTKLDILSCRNLLIYMEPELQKKTISLFYYSLKPGGILLLGSSESPGSTKEWFIEHDSRLKIFRRSPGFGAHSLIVTDDSYSRRGAAETGKKDASVHAENLQSLAEQFVLQNYAPATVLANERGDILFITGHTGKYLEPVAGKANWNIHAMAHESFRHELPLAFRKAAESSEPVVIRQVLVDSRNSKQYVDVTVEHIKNPGALHDMILVAFTEVHPPADVSKIKRAGKPGLREKEYLGELRKAYEDLQSTREEMQTSQEELKSANEELQSTNEELQSTNEELTTSREEMQSLNEELQTVNSELLSKINDLVQSNNDMKNLLNSTEIATLFLDKDLNIRRFTDTVTRIFNLRSSDTGRPYSDIVNNLDYSDMNTDARKVLDTLVPIVKEIKTSSGTWYSVRIMSYRTYDDRIDGLVITFTDITKAKDLEIRLTESNASLRRENLQS